MYTIGSIADIISGSNTPNKPSVEIKEVQASPFKSKKKAIKDIVPEKQEHVPDQQQDTSEKLVKTPKKQKKTKGTPGLDVTKKIGDPSLLTTSKKRKAEPESSEESKKKKNNQESADDTVPKKQDSVNTKSALKRIRKKKKDGFVNPEQDERTIFVGNVPLTTDKKDVMKYFIKYGKVQSVRFRSVARPDLKTPKRAAFIKKQFHPKATTANCYVVFAEKDCAQNSLAANGQIFKDNHIRVDLIRKEIDHNQKQAIFVGNVPFDAKDEDLWSIFESCGRVDSVRLVRDGLTGIGKGYGYVNFDSTDAVELALQMPEVKINNRVLRIKRSAPGIEGTKKRDEQGEKKRLVPRKLKHQNRIEKKKNTTSDDTSTENKEIVDESEVKEENPKKKIVPKVNFQGVKFTDKKKNKKTNKTLLKKKKMSKILAPRKKNT